MPNPSCKGIGKLEFWLWYWGTYSQKWKVHIPRNGKSYTIVGKLPQTWQISTIARVQLVLRSRAANFLQEVMPSAGDCVIPLTFRFLSIKHNSTQTWGWLSHQYTQIWFFNLGLDLDISCEWICNESLLTVVNWFTQCLLKPHMPSCTVEAENKTCFWDSLADGDPARFSVCQSAEPTQDFDLALNEVGIEQGATSTYLRSWSGAGATSCGSTFLPW